MRHLSQHFALMLSGLLLAGTTVAEETKSISLRVTGLFSTDRVDDLRRVVEAIESLTIKDVDFDTAVVTFAYDSKADPFKDADPEKVRSAIDNKLKGGSRHTFAALLPSEIPKDKLERVEIPIAGLDCKACSYAAYRSIYQIDGVVRATASFKERKVTALIETEKTNRAALEEALEKRGVDLKKPAE